jgi:hypothetical protein
LKDDSIAQEYDPNRVEQNDIRPEKNEPISIRETFAPQDKSIHYRETEWKRRETKPVYEFYRSWPEAPNYVSPGRLRRSVSEYMSRELKDENIGQEPRIHRPKSSSSGPVAYAHGADITKPLPFVVGKVSLFFC